MTTTVARHDIPLLLLWYPRLVREPAYLYNKLRFLLGDCSYQGFEKAFSDLVRPEMVHQFGPDDVA